MCGFVSSWAIFCSVQLLFNIIFLSLNTLVINFLIIISNIIFNSLVQKVFAKDIWPTFLFWNKKGSRKKFLWATHLWVGRRYETVCKVISQNNGKQDSYSKKLIFNHYNVLINAYSNIWVACINILALIYRKLQLQYIILIALCRK